MRGLSTIGALALLLSGSPVLAHVPFFEEEDLTVGSPFVIEDVEQSKAVYAWLESPTDIDAYELRVTEPSRIYVKILVPYCKRYRSLQPSYALLGPGLPAPEEELPISLPEGYGAVVKNDRVEAPEDREILFEYFSDQLYFEGPVFDERDMPPGNYLLIYWDPDAEIGDYVAIIGRRENFGAADMLLAAENTPIIRRREYIHGGCDAEF